MRLAVAAPYPVSIWYTPDVYEMMDDAVNAAAALGADFQYEGYMVTGAGFVMEGREETVYRGYLTFVGRAPVGSSSIDGSSTARSEAAGSPRSHLALAAGAGILGGVVIGVLVGYAAR